MVGIEQRPDQDEQQDFDQRAFNQILENLLTSLNDLQTNDELSVATTATTNSNLRQPYSSRNTQESLPRGYSQQEHSSFSSFYDNNTDSDIDHEDMTILPKKKSSRGRSSRSDKSHTDNSHRSRQSRHQNDPFLQSTLQSGYNSTSNNWRNLTQSDVNFNSRNIYHTNDQFNLDLNDPTHNIVTSNHSRVSRSETVPGLDSFNPIRSHGYNDPTYTTNNNQSATLSGIGSQNNFPGIPCSRLIDTSITSSSSISSYSNSICTSTDTNTTNAANSRIPLSSIHQQSKALHISHNVLLGTETTIRGKRTLPITENSGAIKCHSSKLSRKQNKTEFDTYSSLSADNSHHKSIPEKDFSGDHGSDENNSEDEYYGAQYNNKTIEEEIEFEKMIEKKGWCIKKMATDGACLFRAIADQVYGDQEMHDEVRRNVVDYMAKNADHFSQYVTEDFSKYISRKRDLQCYGNHLEIQAIAEVYNRPIEIYYYDIEPCNVFQGDYKTDSPPVRLSYHGNVHYNSIWEPYSATVGVGLGLPGYQPGLADKQLLTEALKASEDYAIEDAMLKDKLIDSLLERSQSDVEEKVAQESYLDWLNSVNRASYGKASSPTDCESSRHRSNQEACKSSDSSPLGAQARESPRTSATAQQEIELADHLPMDMAGWDEDSILAHVLAESTLDYYETLRKSSQPGCSKDS